MLDDVVGFAVEFEGAEVEAELGDVGWEVLGVEVVDEALEGGGAGLLALCGGGLLDVVAAFFAEVAEFFFVAFFGAAGAGFEQRFHGDGVVVLVGDEHDVGVGAEVGIHGEVGEGELVADDE